MPETLDDGPLCDDLLCDDLRAELAPMPTDSLEHLAQYEIDCNGVEGAFCAALQERLQAEKLQAELAMTPIFPEFIQQFGTNDQFAKENAHV